MAYASLPDLEQMGILAAAIDGVSEALKFAALEGASGVADGYLSSAFELPITSWGADLTRHVVAIAVYDLMSTRGYNPDGSDTTIRDRYNDAIRWLERVADGRLKPSGIVDSTPDTYEGASFVVSKVKRGW